MIDGDGENIGVITTGDALNMARDSNLDLVVITENAKPPVAKILDFNKFLYDTRKKQSHSKARSKKSATKEFRIGAKIDTNAIEIKTKRARKFISDGHRIKITVKLKGRERAFPQLGIEKAEKFIKDLEDIAKPENEIKNTGRAISVILVKK